MLLKSKLVFISKSWCVAAQIYTPYLDLTKPILLFYAGKEAIEVKIPQSHQDVIPNDEQ